MTPIEEWKNLIHNDFESTVFKRYPQLAVIKNQLYENKALYASMSGSGSAVYGLFEEEPAIEGLFPNAFVWKEKI